ncbi:MAG: hypothetical protein ACN6PY_13435, partial [Paraburkholderia nemoris]
APLSMPVPVPVPASNAASTSRFTSAHVFANKTVSHRRQPLREEKRKQVEQIHSRTARLAVANPSPHATAIAAEVTHSAIPKVAVNASPKLSAAGAYSPAAPARLGVDEYAGVSMSAATHVRDIAPTASTGSSNNSSSTNGTEWMNHLSQRRVTDVPDQFAK